MSEWSQAQPEAERGRRRRRVVGLVMILISIVLVLLGQFALESYLSESLIHFVLYWGLCALFTMAALFTALVDMILVRHEAAREEKRLAQQTLGDRVKPPDESEDEP